MVAQCILLCETEKGFCQVLAAAWNGLGRMGPQTAWQEPEALFFSSPALPCRSSCQGIPRMSGFCPFVCFSSICHWIIFIHLWLFQTRNLRICLFLDIKGGGSRKLTREFVPPCVTGQDVWACAAWPGQPPSREQVCIGTLRSILGMGYNEAPNLENLGHILCHPVLCPLAPQ